MKNNISSDNYDQNQSKPSGGFMLNFIGILWSIHVLIAALLFPHFLLPGANAEDPKNIQKERLYIGFRIFFGTFILFFNIACIVVLFTRSNLIDAAKVLFVLGVWIMVGIIYIVFNHLRGIYDLLSVLEDDAIQSRDQSVMLIRTGQAALRAGNLKLDRAHLKVYNMKNPENFSFVSLMKKVIPLAVLVIQKGNTKDIVLEVLKLAFAGTRLFKYLI